MKIFIYKLIDPRTNEIRYIGKTKNKLKKRLYEHCTERNLKTNTHKNNWIKQLLNLNLRPKIELLEEVNQDNWIEREMYWIEYFKNNDYNLTNTSDGGEGSFGYKMPIESIKKAIETRRKNGTLKRSDECKKRIAIAQTGKKHTKEQTAKMVAKTRKILLQYDLDGNLIKEWKGVRYCANTLGLNHSSILNSIKRNKPYAGFMWKRPI